MTTQPATNAMTQTIPTNAATLNPSNERTHMDETELEYAGFWIRVVARIVDIILINIVTQLLGLVIRLILGETTAAIGISILLSIVKVSPRVFALNGIQLSMTNPSVSGQTIP